MKHSERRGRTTHSQQLSRREFFRLGSVATAAAAPGLLFGRTRTPLPAEKRLAFYNLHTGEHRARVIAEQFVVGAGNGCAVVCNALLVQRGVADSARGRALTFVMSATFILAGIGNAVGGAVIDRTGPRAIWAAAAAFALAGAVTGYSLARRTTDSEPGRVPEQATPEVAEVAEPEPDWALWANWAG